MKQPAKQTISLGVIGAGAAFRKLHWPVLETMRDEIRVMGICNRTQASAEAAAEMVGSARIYGCYDNMLQDPEVHAVLACVPIELSASVVIDAANSGKHILAEKPIAATPQQAVEVLRACSKTRAVVVIAENFRYRRDLAKAREILDDGKIGDVFAFQMSMVFDLDAETRRVWTERQWRRDAHHAGGFVLDAGIHAVAYLRDLLGDVAEVDARVLDRHPTVGGPDSLLMQMKMANGAVGQFFACYTAKVHRETFLGLTVFGSKGSLQAAPGRVAWTTGGGAPETLYRFDAADRGYRAQWRNFCRAVRGKEKILSTPESAYSDLMVIDAALRSGRSGQRMILPNQPLAAARG